MDNGLAIIEKTDTETKGFYIDQDALEFARQNTKVNKRLSRAAEEKKRLEHKRRRAAAVSAKRRAYASSAVRIILGRSAACGALVWAGAAGLVHGVTFGALRARAEAEKWAELKEKQLHKIRTKTAQKTADAIVKNEVKRVERLLAINDQLIEKIEKAVTELDLTQVTNKKKTKVIEYKNGRRPDKPTKEIITESEDILSVASIVDRKGLQQIAQALKAVWDITGEHEAGKEDEYEDDGLLAALGANAASLFDDGDDSGMLPEGKEE